MLSLPARHAELDGSGFIRSDDRTDRITANGQTFRMNMAGDHMGGELTHRPGRAIRRRVPLRVDYSAHQLRQVIRKAPQRTELRRGHRRCRESSAGKIMEEPPRRIERRQDHGIGAAGIKPSKIMEETPKRIELRQQCSRCTVPGE